MSNRITEKFRVDDSSHEVICTACWHGPCVVGYYGNTQEQKELPDKYIIYEPYVPAQCPAPEYPG